MSAVDLRTLIEDVPDYPKPGIIFKDITPLLAHPAGFRQTIETLAGEVRDLGVDAVLAIESRGFIFGAALAVHLGLPLELVRKRGKLPRETVSVRYELEYGFDHLEVHKDALRPGGRYLIVDDVIATGGTVGAAASLVAQQGGAVAACAFVIELTFLNGRERLGDLNVISLVRY